MCHKIWRIGCFSCEKMCILCPLSNLWEAIIPHPLPPLRITWLGYRQKNTKLSSSCTFCTPLTIQLFLLFHLYSSFIFLLTGSLCVSRASIVQKRIIYFQDEGSLTIRLCEKGKDSCLFSSSTLLLFFSTFSGHHAAIVAGSE